MVSVASVAACDACARGQYTERGHKEVNFELKILNVSHVDKLIIFVRQNRVSVSFLLTKKIVQKSTICLGVLWLFSIINCFYSQLLNLQKWDAFLSGISFYN